MSAALNLTQFDTLIVPRGSEYQAVCRGLQKVTGALPRVVALPIGTFPVRQYLQHLNFLPQQVLLLGLCGSLQPEHRVGDLVLYESCMRGDLAVRDCDASLTQRLAEKLGENVDRVRGFTSDRVIATAAQKRALARDYRAEVVDMEGFAVLEALNAIGASVAMLRVVSDDCEGDIPDLSTAISSEGKLKPLPLTLAFLKQPFAAQRLIRGSLIGLKVLETLFEIGSDSE